MVGTAGSANRDIILNYEIVTTNNIAAMVANRPSFLANARVIYWNSIELSTTTA